MITIGAGKRDPENRGARQYPELSGGIFRSNVFQAQLTDFSGGAFRNAPFTQNSTWSILLFCQDFPVRLKALARYNQYTRLDSGGAQTTTFDAGSLVVPIIPNGGTGQLGVDYTAQSAANVITPASGQPAVLPKGSRLYGTSVTNGLSIAGYPITFTGPNFSTSTFTPADAAAAFTLSLEATCEGGVVAGFEPIQSADAVTTVNETVQVILLQTAYSAAMKAANNTFTYAAGVTAQIVGLYAAGA